MDSSSLSKERYTGHTFKVAKALRNKLSSLNLLSRWETFFGEEADFLSPELKHERVLPLMNSFASMLESHFPGQPACHVGLVLMELCKFTVGGPECWRWRLAVCLCKQHEST